MPLHPVGADGCPCTRSDCTSNGKHPRLYNWPRQASAASALVEAWWSRYPSGGVGIVTGGVSRLLVIDVDPRSGGDDPLAPLEAAHGPLPLTVESSTGGGGRHLFLGTPDDRRLIRNSAGALGAGIDIRGDGGFVVAPPSPHASGTAYTWTAGRSPDEVAVAPAPDWLLDLLQPSRTAAGTPRTRKRAAAESGIAIPTGKRNVTLVKKAGAMRRAGWSGQAIHAALEAENRAVCHPPLPSAEIAQVAKSAAQWLPPWISDPIAFLDDPRLDSLARFVLWGLVQHANHKGETFVGCRGLGAELGLDKDTVARRLKLLIVTGRVEIVSSNRSKTVRRVKPFAPVATVASPRGGEAQKGSYVPPDQTRASSEAA